MHEIEEIALQCIALDKSLGALGREATELSKYACQTRDPSGRPDPSEQEARDALDLSQRLYDAVLARVPRTPSS